MSNPPQNSDRFSLDETLAVMERLGRPEDYRLGYSDALGGVILRVDSPFAGADPFLYRRGHRAGVLARLRGAHGGEAS